MNLEELRKHFVVPGITFDDDEGGLTRVRVKSSQASGELFVHGAHCAAWQPAGQTAVLWMSQRSYYETGKPIRGGVPICFPWFGPHASDKSLPAHGSSAREAVGTVGYPKQCRRFGERHLLHTHCAIRCPVRG